MKKIDYILKDEASELQKVIKCARDRLKVAPKGFLRITKKNNRTEYYYKEVNSHGANGKYIKKENIALASKIAQRDYDSQIMKMAEMRLKAINGFMDIYEKTDLKEVYQKINSYRRELLQDTILSDEEYIRRWLAAEYTGKSFADDYPEIITEKGERVRSKSEKIIADKLYSLGIPYRYEYPLTLSEGIKIYPDFTILRIQSREEVYLEHLGMMDDENYVSTVMYKLNTYERNGIYLGVNLFITHETSRTPLNTKTLDGLIKKLFCEEI